MTDAIDRRRFLLMAGALAAVASGVRADPQPPASPASRPKRTLRKAVMYGMIGDGHGVLEKFQILRDCGFEGVEFDSPSSIPRDEVLKARDATGIAVHGVVDSVHWKFHLNNPEVEVRKQGLEGLTTALRDAGAFGSSSVLLVPALVNAQMPYDDAWTLSQEAIRAALPVAEECKVVIAVENVWNNFLLSPAEAKRYVDDFRSPWVAWHLDIGNVINYGWPEQWARILGPRVRKLHIKDFSRGKRDKEGLWKGFDVELGEGDAGWARVMAALDEIGYATAPAGNWATAEVRGGDRERLKTIAGQMDRLFAM